MGLFPESIENTHPHAVSASGWRMNHGSSIMWRRNAMRNFLIGTYFIHRNWPWVLLSSTRESKIPRQHGGGGNGYRLKLRKLTPKEKVVYNVMTS